MFKGFKEFTYKMIAGANVATIIIMLLVGFSDFFQPEKFAALANLGLLLCCSSGLSMPLFHS